MTYILRERCVGTGALSYHVCGARRLASYIGNKLKYAAQLVEIMQIKGPPQRLIWWDTGEWANTLATLHVYGKWRAQSGARAAVALHRGADPERVEAVWAKDLAFADRLEAMEVDDV